MPTVTYLPHRVSGSTLTVVGRSQLLARWPGTHSRILSRIQRAAQTVRGVYLKRTCSRVTSASSALGVLNDHALYKSTHALTPVSDLRRNSMRRVDFPTHPIYTRPVLGRTVLWFVSDFSEVCWQRNVNLCVQQSYYYQS